MSVAAEAYARKSADSRIILEIRNLERTAKSLDGRTRHPLKSALLLGVHATPDRGGPTATPNGHSSAPDASAGERDTHSREHRTPGPGPDGPPPSQHRRGPGPAIQIGRTGGMPARHHAGGRRESLPSETVNRGLDRPPLRLPTRSADGLRGGTLPRCSAGGRQRGSIAGRGEARPNGTPTQPFPRGARAG
jgi:hypothetical protein